MLCRPQALRSLLPASSESANRLLAVQGKLLTCLVPEFAYGRVCGSWMLLMRCGQQKLLHSICSKPLCSDSRIPLQTLHADGRTGKRFLSPQMQGWIASSPVAVSSRISGRIFHAVVARDCGRESTSGGNGLSGGSKKKVYAGGTSAMYKRALGHQAVSAEEEQGYFQLPANRSSLTRHRDSGSGYGYGRSSSVRKQVPDALGRVVFDREADCEDAATLERAQLTTSSSSQQPQQEEAEQEGMRSSMEAGPAWLKELRIRNFVLVEEEVVRFCPRLNVITGESGAGKSIILQALSQALAVSVAEDCVRPPATSAQLQATFAVGPEVMVRLQRLPEGQPAVMSALTAALTGGANGKSGHRYVNVVLEREIATAGEAVGGVRNGHSRISAGGERAVKGKSRGVCRINGVVVPFRVLRRVGSLLVDLNGQNSQGALRSGAAQVQLLDVFAGTSSSAMAFAELTKRAAELAEETVRLGEGGLEEEELQKLVDDVARLGLTPGIERELRAKLQHQARSQEAASQCAHVLARVSPLQGGRGREASLLPRMREVRRDLETLERLASVRSGRMFGQRRGASWRSEEEAEEEDEEERGLAGACHLAEALQKAEEAEYLYREVASLVEDFSGELEYSELKITSLQRQLKQVELLLTRHEVKSSEEILEMVDAAEARLASSFDVEQRKEELRAAGARVASQMSHLAVDLSTERRVAAERMRHSVQHALRQLSMENSRFHVDISWEMGPSYGGKVWREETVEEGEEEDGEDEEGGDGQMVRDEVLVSDKLLRVTKAAAVGEPSGAFFRYSPSGLDRVTFKLAPRDKEPLLPLSHVASGGECSRVMLALKTTSGAAGASSPPVAVFDELDSGIGGRIGAKVGEALSNVASSSHQVLCVMHLPQVAVFADQHITVRKEPTHDGRTVTKTFILHSLTEKAAEVASMLGLETRAALDLYRATGKHADAMDDMPHPQK